MILTSRSVNPNPNKSTAQVSFSTANRGNNRLNSSTELSKPCNSKIGVPSRP